MTKKERRQSIRFPVPPEQQKGLLVVGWGKYPVRLIDISAGGVGIRTGRQPRVKVGQTVRLRTDAGWTEARVAYIAEQADGFRLGFQWLARSSVPWHRCLRRKQRTRRWTAAGIPALLVVGGAVLALVISPSTVKNLWPLDHSANWREATVAGDDLVEKLYKATHSTPLDKVFNHASTLLQRAEAVPEKPPYRQELARSLHRLAVRLHRTGQIHEAEKVFADAFAILEKLTDQSSSTPADASSAGETLHQWALARLERGDLKGATELLTKAITFQSGALNHQPQNSTYRYLLLSHYQTLTETLLRSGSYTEVAHTAQELARSFSDHWQDSYLAACLLARCAPMAKEDTRLPEQKRTSLSQSLADQAIELLRMSVKDGFRDVEQLKNNPALEPLKNREDFQKLLVQLEQSAQSPEGIDLIRPPRHTLVEPTESRPTA